MKKLFMMLLAGTLLSASVNAQEKKVEAAKPAVKKEAKAPKAATPATPATPAQAATPAAAPAKKGEGKHVKADGTPDKRFKENKEAGAKPEVHMKKDGTPDKRFKENKDAKAPVKKG